MHRSRRQFLRSTAGAFLATAAGGQFAPSALASSIGAALGANTGTSAGNDDFDIDQAFAEFMRGLGRSADDAGGRVTFTGRDPILRSHFRIGT